MSYYEQLELVGKIAGVVWLVAGPLVGIYIGAQIANRNQREQWLAENEKQEYKELLTALTQAFTGLIDLSLPVNVIGPEEQQGLSNLERQAMEVIEDRFFIADKIKGMKLLKRWNEATRDFDRTHDRESFARTFGEIKRSIMDAARHITK
jgi:hypothetical protein